MLVISVITGSSSSTLLSFSSGERIGVNKSVCFCVCVCVCEETQLYSVSGRSCVQELKRFGLYGTLVEQKIIENRDDCWRSRKQVKVRMMVSRPDGAVH